MAIRGIRGATTVKANAKKEILSATEELLKEIVSKNSIKPEDVASIIFSASKDLNAEFPAVAARNLGWIYTPLICTNEIAVPGSLRKCVRVLFHVNSTKKQKDMKNVYLNGALKLRPDLGSKEKGIYYLS